MTVIVWRADILATDQQMTVSETKQMCQKLFKGFDKAALATCGDYDRGMYLIEWYNKGADLNTFLTYQSDKEDWARLVVLTSSGCKYIEKLPVWLYPRDNYAAWGSGREAALGALHAGVCAGDAVRAAIKHVEGCGFGVDSICVRQL